MSETSAIGSRSARRGVRIAVALMAAIALAPASAATAAPGKFELVGDSPLLNRGMNAGLAVHGEYAYVGSRTDGTHPNAGVLVVDVSNPAAPRVVHQIGPPEEGNPGETSRELRVWPEQGLLIVEHFECDPVGHLCAGAEFADVPPSFRFYDIRGAHAAAPKLIATYRPSRKPHEFFLWEDPKRADRALLYISTSEDEDADHELLVTDISDARTGRFRELDRWSARFDEEIEHGGLHSVGVSPDGERAYIAHLAAGFLVADTSDFARAKPRPRVREVTPPRNSVHREVPGVHSAVELPDRPRYALITDEVYGSAFGLGPVLGFPVLQGCPWGWARTIDVADPARPRVIGEYKIHPYNDRSYCDDAPPLQEAGASFSSHNPTLTPHLALITWHSGGLQAVRLDQPSEPAQAAAFLPDPRPAVATEDPALSSGTDKVVMWSYPIVQDGLVYVVDLRNGLYVLRYRGPHERELSCVRFLEGNSNLGNARHPCPERIRVTVRPRRTRAGRDRTYAVSTTIRQGRGAVAVSGATVALAGRRVRTGGDGRARMKLRIRRPGRYGVRATKPGLRAGRTTVRVLPARSRTRAPGLTG